MICLCTLVYGEVYDLPVCESTACIAHWFAVCTRVCVRVCVGGYARMCVSVHVVYTYVKDHPPSISLIASGQSSCTYLRA